MPIRRPCLASSPPGTLPIWWKVKLKSVNALLITNWPPVCPISCGARCLIPNSLPRQRLENFSPIQNHWRTKWTACCPIPRSTVSSMTSHASGCNCTNWECFRPILNSILIMKFGWRRVCGKKWFISSAKSLMKTSPLILSSSRIGPWPIHVSVNFTVYPNRTKEAFKKFPCDPSTIGVDSSPPVPYLGSLRMVPVIARFIVECG